MELAAEHKFQPTRDESAINLIRQDGVPNALETTARNRQPLVGWKQCYTSRMSILKTRIRI